MNTCEQETGQMKTNESPSTLYPSFATLGTFSIINVLWTATYTSQLQTFSQYVSVCVCVCVCVCDKLHYLS